MKPIIHAQLDARQLGGEPGDYMAIHEFMDSSKSAISDNRHRTLTHNSWFIGIVIPRVFGETFQRASDGKTISSRDIAERHCMQDFKGFIPTAQDYIQEMQFMPWMNNGQGTRPTSCHKLIPNTNHAND